MSDLVEIYLQWQSALARWGCTPATDRIFWRLAREIEHDPFLNTRGFEATLERLHRQAYPIASSRPPRLRQAEELVTFLED
jgi:hypothetical protein